MVFFMKSKHWYMKKAISLAKLGIFTTMPNPNVGCIIVDKNGIIVGQGWHKKTGESHAEINALVMAGKKAFGSTAYITLEPCNYFGHTPPCCEALVQAGINKVICSMLDPNPKNSGRGIDWLKKKGVTVELGIMSKESSLINFGFINRMKTGFPWVQLKLAASIDGKIAMKNGESKWITSIDSRQDVQYFRAKSSAILSTSNTILNDNSLLTVRYKDMNLKTRKFFHYSKKIRQPTRIIIDSKNQINPSNPIIQTEGAILLARLKSDNKIWPKNVEEIIIPNRKNNRIDLIYLLSLLGKRQINNVWIEAGASISGAFLRKNIIDELILYIAPKILGSQSKSLFKIKDYISLCSVPKLKFTDIRQINSDLRLTLKFKDKFVKNNK